MSIWKALDQQTSTAMDEAFGERFRLTPLEEQSPNGRRDYDSDRITVEGTCVFDYETVQGGIKMGVRKTFREANDLRAASVGRQPKASIDLRAFPTLAEHPKKGDRFELLDRPELAAFHVLSVQRDGQARMVLMLTIEGSPA